MMWSAEKIFNLSESSRLVEGGTSCLHEAAMKAPSAGLIVELGTGNGTSARALNRFLPGRTVHTCDWFRGLPEAWNQHNPQGKFSRDGSPPAVPPGVQIVLGLYKDSLVPFLAANPGPLALLHVDCDLYSSTAFAFCALQGRIADGTVVVFDELWGADEAGRDHEAKAFAELLDRTGLTPEPVCHSPGSVQSVFVMRNYGPYCHCCGKPLGPLPPPEPPDEPPVAVATPWSFGGWARKVWGWM